MGVCRLGLLTLLIFFAGMGVLKAEESGEETVEKEASQIAVMPLTPKQIAPETVSILDELLLAAVNKQTRYEVIGISDIEAMLGLEKIKDVLGCGDVSCAAEIGGSLGIEQLLAGSVSQLGEMVIINLKLINTLEQKVNGRGQAEVKADESLFAQAVKQAVSDLFKEDPNLLGASATLDAAMQVETQALPLSPEQKQFRRIVLWSMVGLSALSASVWGYYLYEADRLQAKTRTVSGSAENANKIARRGKEASDFAYTSSIATGISVAGTLGLWWMWEF
jgi:TolB-like protein